MAKDEGNEKNIKQEIVCPYCFKKFVHSDVCFRSNTYFNDLFEIEERIGKRKSEIDFLSSNSERRELEKKFDIYERFLLKKDEKYQNFWDNFDGNTTEIKSKWDSCNPWDKPIISSGNGIKELLYDKDGFVRGAVDEFDKETEDRVCPHCHNPLPVSFGKNKVNNISIIGVVGSGKTVYISQLLKNFGQYVAKIGLSANSISDHEQLFIENNPVKKGIPLPDSTSAKSFSQPLFYDITKTANDKTIVETIVIYDIAGENCRDPKAMGLFGKYVKKADGIIFLIDPRQINFVTDTIDADEPAKALSTLHLILDKEQGSKCLVPIAVCISKSDECFNILPPVARQDIQVSSDFIKKPSFDARTFNSLVSGENGLARLMNNHAADVCQNLKTGYKNFNFFAVSAIGCTCGRTNDGLHTPNNIPRPKRIEEPLFWLFKQFGIIDTNDRVNRPFPVEQPAQYEYRKPFFGKAYLEKMEDDFSIFEEDEIRVSERVLKNKKWLTFSSEFDDLPIKQKETEEK